MLKALAPWSFLVSSSREFSVSFSGLVVAKDVAGLYWRLDLHRPAYSAKPALAELAGRRTHDRKTGVQVPAVQAKGLDLSWKDMPLF
jgi:hypothetical protein